MQNRYTGDIGDFAKLGLLRALQAAGLTIGVNWYLVPDESHNDDGRFTEYQKKAEYQCCDEALCRELKHIVDSKDRRVKKLQNDHILNAAFYDKPLDFSGMTKPERITKRNSWLAEALKTLSGADLVFADPDNGLIVKTAAETKRENKFVLPAELKAYYQQGSSVVYYQHKARRPDQFYYDQHKALLRGDEFAGAAGFGLKFCKTSQRYFFFIVHPEHKAIVKKTLKSFLASPWGAHFSGSEKMDII